MGKLGLSTQSWSVTAKVRGFTIGPISCGSAFSLTLTTVGAVSTKRGGSLTSVTVTITFTVAVAVDGSLALTRRT